MLYHINILTAVKFRKDATCFRYYGDGTGRDSYMLRDFGGLVCDYSRENKTVGDFYKSLRSGSMSQTVDSSNPGSMYHATKNWLSPKAKRVIKECFVQQLSLTNRLSTPKGQIRQRQPEGTNSMQSLERENGESA